MTAALEWSFWACVGGVTYAYVLYPAVIYALSRIIGQEPRCEAIDERDLPRLSLLIAAHNEEDVIEARIRNALALDYPRDRFEIVIASDGSSDQTANIVRRFDGQVRLLDYRSRRGKSATLNAAMREVTGEIVMLSDANTSIDPSAARRLARWFVDPDIGAVCGRLVIVDPQHGANVDGVYWKYETFLKRCENRLGALLGSNGAIYAIRRELFEPIPDNTIVDDFVIPLRARLRSDCRLIYDVDAVGIEEAAPHLKDEFRRRVRIGAGGFQAIGLLWPLLSPRFGWTAFAFLSHKVFRWLCPLLLLVALGTSMLLAEGNALYLALLAAQILFYATPALTPLLPGSPGFLRPVRLAAMFVGMNLALLLGLVRWLRGAQQGIWQRTQRASYAAARS